VAFFYPMSQKKTTELQRLSPEAFASAPKTPIRLILNDLRSHHNVGACFRTADAFILEKLYLCGITASPPHRDIQKTALGATETVAWEYHADALALVQQLQAEGVEVWAVEQTHSAIELQDVCMDPNKTYALVLGNEVFGVAPELLEACTQHLEIPQWGSKHSLNVSVCAGVVVWECVRKLRWP